MNEREIRDLLATIRADLDRGLRLVRKAVIPAAVGAGLALGACSDEGASIQPDSMKPDTAMVDAGAGDKGPADDKGPTPDQNVADGSTPDQKVTPDILPHWEFLPPPPYMAPDAAPFYQQLERKA
jgi:hypothetical protein